MTTASVDEAALLHVDLIVLGGGSDGTTAEAFVSRL